MTIWNKPIKLLQTTESLKIFPVTLSSFARRKEHFSASSTFKRNLCGKRMAIERAYSHNYDPSETKSITSFITLRGLNVSFRRKKGILPCFALEERNENPLTSEKKEIRMGQEGPSIWLVNKVQNLTKKLMRHKVAKSMPSSFEQLVPNKPKENKFFTFGRALHYRLQKNFSKFELSLRQGSQLFTIYVFGSFYWLYLTRYSSGTSQFTLSKSFLFQEIFLENLPLFSENKLFSGEIREKFFLTPMLDNFSYTFEKSRTNKKFQAIELSSSFSEKLESYRALKYLKSEKLEAFTNVFSNYLNSDILLFFARKPIFIKNFSFFPGNKTFYSSFKVPKLEHQEKALIPKCLADKAKLAFVFFKKQTLPQKTVYALSGTSLIINPEIDIIPRKLEGLVTSRKSGSGQQNTFNKKRIIHKKKTGKFLKKKFSSINFQPFGKFESSTKRSTQTSQQLKEPKLTLPQNVLWCKKIFSTKTKWRENSLLVFEPAKTQQELHKLAVPVQQKNFRLVHSQGTEIVNQGIFFQKMSLKGKNELLEQKRKVHFRDSFKKPPLQSGFEFPNVPIIDKNKEKLKRGLGISISPKDSFGINSTISKPISFSIKKPIRKKAKNINSKPSKINNLNYVLNLNSRLESSKKLIFHIKPFLDWHYQPEFKTKTRVYIDENNEKIILLENKITSEYVRLDKHTDLKTTLCSLEEKFSLKKKEKTFLEDVFSYKRKSFNGALNAPENFFGNPYLKLGEPFTIEQLHGKTQLQILSTLHGGDLELLLNTPASPYASMGTSLNTVFGKKQLTNKVPTLGGSSKDKNILATSRLVKSWSKGADLNNQILLKNWLEEEQGKEENNSLTLQEKKEKFFKILYFKEQFGKKNRKINFLFKYYQGPEINKEKARAGLYITEGYKKSKLFPTIHNSYRILCTQSFPIYDIESKTPNMDIDLQSILGGVRQGIEGQRRAYYLQQLSPENVANKKDPDNNIILSKKTQRILALEQKKKIDRLSNYYPPFTSLIVSPQKSFPQKALGSRELVDYNLSSSFKVPTLMSLKEDLKGSIQNKGSYFEKFLCSTDKGIFFLISTNFLSKFFFFAVTWYIYILLTKPLFKAIKYFPATFTEAIGLQSFQEKFRIEKKSKQTLKNLAGAEKTLVELRDLIWTFKLIGTETERINNNVLNFLPYFGNRKGQSRPSVLAKSPNRLLLYGPPGTGKTLLVKVLAAEANVPVIVQPVSSLPMIAGVKNPISAIFHMARQLKPCIIFLDELDTLGSDVILSTNKSSTAEEHKAIKLRQKYTYSLLLELDGLTSDTKDLLIIGATNRPETLNPALIRAGRFDTLLDCNLPSQEVRTSLFSFYLKATKQLHQNKNLFSKIKNKFKLTRQFISSISSRGSKKPKLKHFLASSKKSANKSFSFESYLAAKCSGLSHASIATIINESALEAMLQKSGDQPSHTLETLERAINSVKTLTFRSTSSNFNSVFSPVVSKDSEQNNLLSTRKDKKNYLYTTSLKSEKEHLFKQEFLVNRIYQIIGSLIFDQKSYQGTKKSFFYAKKGTHSSSLFLKKLHKTTKQKITPINRKDFQSVLLREYSGKACSSIYTTLKPQTFKILARSGLYQTPSYVSSILLTLKGLMENNFSDKVLEEKITESRTLNTKKKQEGFISEKVRKNFFPYNSNLDSSNFQSTAPEKSLLFWKNPKVFKKSFSSGTFQAKQSKEKPQTLLMVSKAAKYSKTNWFRVHLARPFIHYETFDYIENKEYIPKNIYMVKQKSLLLRNVSTLSHTPSFHSTNLKQLAFFSKNDIAFNAPDPGFLTDKKKFTGKFSPQKSIETKHSLYLAIVASIFHKSIKFYDKNRELTDYCVYTFLRYGIVFEFYQEHILKKF